MFFSASIRSRDVVETLRSKDPIKLCAAKLQTEYEEFDFRLDATYCDARDVILSLEQNNYFESWETFFNTLRPFRTKSKHIRIKAHHFPNHKIKS